MKNGTYDFKFNFPEYMVYDICNAKSLDIIQDILLSVMQQLVIFGNRTPKLQIFSGILKSTLFIRFWILNWLISVSAVFTVLVAEAPHHTQLYGVGAVQRGWFDFPMNDVMLP